MSFWSWLNNEPSPTPAGVTPGDPNGAELVGEETYSRSLPFPVPSPWSGWPSEWATPNWQGPFGLSRLIDSAWTCLDLNSRVLAAMPVYRLQSGRIVDPLSWMTNPDPSIYTSWYEFAKQLFWDLLLGEVFILPMATGADGYPLRFRVIPPWLINVEMSGGSRAYLLGSRNVTEEILHIRYQSTTDDAHGHGPLESAGARMTTAGVLQRYARNLAETGGVPHYWMGVERRLTAKEAEDLLIQWVESRSKNLGYPALLSGGATLNQLQSMNAKDMALLELAQFSESRIAVLLGVPPFLVGLPSGGDSMTYSNSSNLFDFHDRSSIGTLAMSAMSALSNWALPRGQAVELNREEYRRPSLLERFQAYKIGVEIGALDRNDVRSFERLHGDSAADQLTGMNTGTAAPTPAVPSGGPPRG